MSNPFEQFLSAKPPAVEGTTIEGNFYCQRPDCFLDSDQAEYLPQHQILRWICADGHVSQLDKFSM